MALPAQEIPGYSADGKQSTRFFQSQALLLSDTKGYLNFLISLEPFKRISKERHKVKFKVLI